MGESPDKNNLIDEMLTAINASMNYLQKQGGSFYFVKNGVFQGEIQGNHLYEFDTNYLDDLPDDTDIDLKIENNSYEGKIYSTDALENKIQVSLTQYIGHDVPEAKIIVTNGYLLKLLIDRLTEVKEGKINLTNLCTKVIFPQTANIDYKDVIVSRNKFDEYKEDAARHALGSEVSYIWGPPGTGKTTLLAKIIQQLSVENKSILLLSHTNVATDKVLKSYIIETNFDFASPDNIGAIIRLGAHPSEEIKEHIEYLGLKNVIAKKQIPIQKEINNLNTKIQDLKNNEQNINSQLKLHDEIDKKSEQYEIAKQKVGEYEDLYKKLTVDHKTTHTELEQLDQRISHFQQSNFISKFFSGTSLEKLVDNKTKLIQSRESIEYKQQKVVKETTTINSQIALLKSYLETSKRPHVSVSELRNELGNIKSEIKNCQDEVNVFRKKLEEIELTVIAEAKMIVSTLSNAYVSKALMSRSYDCVIVDEVSMAPIPALFFAAGLAKTKVVLVGDFCQLPPIAQYGVADNDDRSDQEKQIEKQLVDKWLLQDIFKHSGTEAVVRSGDNATWLKQLKRQYRMHPDIADVVNEITYSQFGNDYKLESGENTYNKGKNLIESDPIPGARIAVINTELSNTREFRTKSGSYYNLYSAILCTSIASRAINSGYKKVGIITPFRPQANLLQKMVKDKNLQGNVSADTVHRFQGEERDLIIFDLVSSFPTILTDDGGVGGNDEKLINVALSRAESKCLLVCDVPKVEKKHSSSSAILKIVKWCKEHNLPIVDSQSVLAEDIFNTEQEWLARTQGINNLNDIFKESKASDEKDFYKHFCKDILTAKKEIIIDSPFITKDRSDYLLPFLDFALRKGVKIYVLTRLAEDQDGLMKTHSQEVIRSFEDRGIVVLPFKGLPHRKLAIIDREVLWAGSLNILSQKNSQEIMFRTEGATTCNQLLSFLRIDKNIGNIDEDCKLIHCEFCNKPGAWYWSDVGRFGLWTFCLVGGHKRGKPPKTKEEVKQKKDDVRAKRRQKKTYTSNGKPLCPDHNKEMILKKGRYGEFWGCTEYPKCKITEKYKG